MFEKISLLTMAYSIMCVIMFSLFEGIAKKGSKARRVWSYALAVSVFFMCSSMMAIFTQAIVNE